MKPEGDIKIALISDLHIYDTLSVNESQPSYVRVGASDTSPGTNPIVDLIAFIEEQQIASDALLCLGDIADKGRPSGLQYGWQKVNEIASRLGAGTVLATSGNHDCDSRFVHNDYDAKGVLQELQPLYPLQDVILADQYWSRNFIILDWPKYRIVSLNSSAYHGGSSDELTHGRVSTRTVERLRRSLDEGGEKPMNVLMCHHHPHQHSEIGLGDSDVMRNGQALIDMLSSGQHGRWIIVHGHKHHPKVSYAQGHGGSPVVLACGSVSATLYPALGTNVRNQFHILATQTSDLEKFGLVGTVYSWEWTFGAGWTPATRGNGLPARAGFGFRCTPDQIATLVADAVDQQPRIAWQTVLDAVPQLKFILPVEFEMVRRRLRSSFGIEILDRDGMPFEVGKLS